MTLQVDNFFNTLITTLTNIRDQSNNVNNYFKDDSSDIGSNTNDIANHSEQSITTLKNHSADRASEAKRILEETLSSESKEMQSIPILKKIWSSLQAEPGFPTQPFKDESIDFNTLNEITAPLKEPIDSIKAPINIDIDSLYKNQDDDDDDKSDDEEAPAELKHYIEKIECICNLHCLISSLSNYNTFLQENYEAINSQAGEEAKSLPSSSPDPELLSKISSLEGQIAEKDNQLSELRTKVSSLETEKANALEQVKKLQDDLESKNKELASKINDEATLKKLKEENDDFHNQIFNLTNALKDKEQTIKELQSAAPPPPLQSAVPPPLQATPPPIPLPLPSNNNNNEEIEKLKAELKDAKERNDFWRQSQEQEQARLKEQLNQKEEELKKLIESNKNDETKVLNENLKTQLHWKEEDLKKLQAEIQQYKQAEAQNKEQLQKLNEQAQQFTQLQATNQSLQSNLQQYQQNYAKLQQINKGLNQKGIAVTRQLQTANQQIKQLQEQIQKSGEQASQKPPEQEEKAANKEETQKQPVDQKQIEQYETMINNLKSENIKLKKTLAASQQKKQAAESNKASPEMLQAEIAKLKEQLKVETDARNFDRTEASNRAALAQHIAYEIKRYANEYI